MKAAAAFWALAGIWTASAPVVFLVGIARGALAIRSGAMRTGATLAQAPIATSLGTWIETTAAGPATTLAAAAAITMILAGLIGAMVYLLHASLILRKSRTARITATILSALSIPIALTGIPSLIWVTLGASGVVCSWLVTERRG